MYKVGRWEFLRGTTASTLRYTFVVLERGLSFQEAKEHRTHIKGLEIVIEN